MDDGADNREPEADPAGGPFKAAERLEQVLGFLRRDNWPAVRDHQRYFGITHARADLEMASRLVVANSVVDQVGDHPLEQPRLAPRPRRLKLRLDRDPVLLD